MPCYAGGSVPRVFFRFVFAAALAASVLLVGCAEQPKAVATHAASHRMAKVRTTAYTRGERGGKHNAVGSSLAGRHVMSAASDWSRFPLGTHFRIAGTNDEYMIDDYGVALVGTNTIDLYKPSRLEMKRWGVRRVDIDVLEWGSPEKSLKILAPRAHHSYIRRMIADLQKKSGDARPVWATE
jgi:3D (Asp-Asp-Asp) domain-containing protein